MQVRWTATPRKIADDQAGRPRASEPRGARMSWEGERWQLELTRPMQEEHASGRGRFQLRDADWTPILSALTLRASATPTGGRGQRGSFLFPLCTPLQ